MKNPVYTVAALALIVGSGLVHGAWTNRWRTAPALAELAARLESVPTVLGDWTATSQAIPPRELAMAGAVGQISRVYTNPTKGLTVSVLLLCGLPGNISTHTPDACYPGAGYTLGNGQRFVHRYGVPERAAEFQAAVASRAGTKPSSLRLYWAWHGSSGWSAPRIHAGLSLPSRCSRSFTSCGKQAESRLIPKKILVLSSCLFCSPNSIA